MRLSELQVEGSGPNESHSFIQSHSTNLCRRSKNFGRRPYLDCPGSLDLISELVGHSFRKNSDWLILGNVLLSLELVRSGPDASGSQAKEWHTAPQQLPILNL